MKTLGPLWVLTTATCLAAAPSPAPILPPSALPPPVAAAAAEFSSDPARAGDESLPSTKEAAARAQREREVTLRRALGLPLAPENEETAGIAGEVEMGGGGIGNGIVTAPLGEIPALPGRAPAPSLVVQFDKATPGTLANIQEDLAVMTRILNKKVLREFGRQSNDSAMGIAISTVPGTQLPHSLYLQGYGALFLLNVRFPLLPPEHGQVEKPEAAPDSDWEQAKQELYGSRQSTKFRFLPNSGGGWVEAAGEPIMEYRAEHVEKLKQQLIEALKAATHIRNLKPDEYVTVSVTGPATGRQIIQTRRSALNNGRSGGRLEFFQYSPATPGSVYSQSNQSVLTIHVKKSDVDAFAQGKISEDEFVKLAAIAVYSN